MSAGCEKSLLAYKYFFLRRRSELIRVRNWNNRSDGEVFPNNPLQVEHLRLAVQAEWGERRLMRLGWVVILESGQTQLGFTASDSEQKLEQQLER